ncbi:MAG: YicC family protein, partial [Pseudorhodoplanes sp.]
MALSSMTGFARSHGVAGTYVWSWELKSVNAKGLEMRLRLPPGWDAIDSVLRARAAETLSRGTVHATLTVAREGVTPIVRVNEPVLNAVLTAIGNLSGRVEAAAPRMDGILALKGVIDVIDPTDDVDERAGAEKAVIAGFVQALTGLSQMRAHEGAALGVLLSARLSEIAALTKRAEDVPGRKPDAIKARLAAQVAELLEASNQFDAERLHQEAVLLATKADVREE